MDDLDRKKKYTSATAALLTAITLGLLQQGLLGEGIFALQLTITFISCSWIPYFYHIHLTAKLSNFVCITGGAIWICTCFGPVFVELLKELFFGHQKPDATFIDAIWRVYAIMGLWILFALLMERIIRPYWRKNSENFLKPFRKYSVSGGARKIAIEKRSKALDGVVARINHQKDKKKNAAEAIENKKHDIEKARKNIEKATEMLERAEKKAEECDDNDKEDANDIVKYMQSSFKTSVDHEKGLHQDIARLKKEIEQADEELTHLKHEYREALHIDNYTGFYR